jgi:hypothetical protein
MTGAPNGSCQTAHTNKYYKDSVTVPVKLIDDCIHYKVDKEYYEYVADSVSWVAVEYKKEIKEMANDKYKWFGAGWLGATITAGLIFILAR